MDAPFYSKPQPLASVEVASFKPGSSITVDSSSLAWPDPIDTFDGTFRVQAVYRRNADGHSHHSEGNLHTTARTVELDAARDDTVELSLTQRIEEETPAERANLKWFRMKSDILTKALGRDTYMSAGLAFPRGYDELDAPRRFWPAIYVVPGFGGDETMAEHYASMLLAPGTDAIAPQAVYVVLDPDGLYGHHGFADSANNGPRGEALVKELIPALEKRFRLVAKPEARLVTGHSSGGWSSLWLQLTYPDVFGACFSSAPDPVDFSAFQLSDLYRDTDLFTDDEGREEASFRQPLGPNEDRVMMTVREEVGVEHVLGPHGDSGEQWGAWNAMFSAKDPTTGFPKRMFDPVTGAVNRAVVEEAWSAYDIAKRTEREWATLGPVFAQKVHLVCGDRDSYYLNRAVERLRDKIEALKDKDVAAGRPAPSGPGYIELVPRATHETVVPLTTIRFNKEMIEHLRRYGLHQ
jgi:S-formylglutathione hydrolase FrmB